jgi:tripartite-type tricarboxylate transporter receptor subunit TctC
MDVVTRVLAEPMRGSLGQPVIVENVTGANGTIATGRVARAAPDGYILVVGTWSTHVANGAVYKLPYDVLTDFEPISLLVNVSFLIVAKKSVPADSLPDFIKWLKSNPDQALEGHSGTGSSGHLGGALFQSITGTHFRYVPYRGPNLVIQDLVAGRIDWSLANPTDGLPLVRSGNIKAYAVTAANRVATAPDIPSVDEAGLPGFYISSWSGIWAPKGTPKGVVAKLSGAVVDALANMGVRQRLAEIGQEIFPREQQTPEALYAFQKAEIEKWWPVIKAAGIKLE